MKTAIFMRDTSSERLERGRASNRGDRLDSWKGIAAYLGRTVRTVQRWEREHDLPVHRLLHNTHSSVYAFTEDLEAWMAGRNPSESPEEAKSRLSALSKLERRSSSRIDIEAHESYLRARHFMGKRTAASVVQAIRDYRKALDFEPTWALPHAGIAEAFVVLGGSEFKSPRDTYPRAMAAALQALELQPELASAHAALGFVRAFFEADWKAAASAFTAALASDPKSAVAHYWSGLVLMNRGHFAEAKDAILRAVDLDPLSAAMTANVSRPLICAGDWGGALDWCHRAMDLDPDFWLVHLFKGFAHDGKGEHEQARAAFAESARLGGSGGVVASLAHACAKQGDRRTAETMVQQLREQNSLYVSPVRFARIWTALGDHDGAFEYLESACADQSIRSNTYPHYDYALEPLRSDPRFERVLQALNLRLSTHPR